MADGTYLRSDGGNIAAFLYNMRENPDFTKYYERILRYIRIVLPQFYDFVLEPNPNGYLPLNWRQAGCEEIFGPHQFSDGALRFVALTTLLLQPAVTAPMTIILDEPEIGLHPYAISILAKEMRMASKTSQIIVSTQSPLLLNEFSCKDVITAEYDSVNQCSVLKRHKEAELREWLDEYTLSELWEKNVLGGLPL
ncbi:MAG: AAA family ATPase [Lachnospiraceae bacterium]|nr:AAA family ATPase [Lachnospiraceae bacterium]